MVHIPDDLARRLGTAGEIERRALEALAIEEYRLGHLTETDVRRLLGFEAGSSLDNFLKARDVSEPRTSVPGALDEQSRARARQAATTSSRAARASRLAASTSKTSSTKGVREPCHRQLDDARVVLRG